MITVEVLIVLSEKIQFLEFGEKWAKMTIFEHFFDFSKINSLSIFNSPWRDSCYPRLFLFLFQNNVLLKKSEMTQNRNRQKTDF